MSDDATEAVPTRAFTPKQLILIGAFAAAAFGGDITSNLVSGGAVSDQLASVQQIAERALDTGQKTSTELVKQTAQLEAVVSAVKGLRKDVGVATRNQMDIARMQAELESLRREVAELKRK